MGKQHMISFNKSSQRREKVLDLVYSDVCGPMKCILLSFGDKKFGYKFYDLVEKKIIRSRDVVFTEDQNIKDFDKLAEVTYDDDLVDLDSEDEDNLEKIPTSSMIENSTVSNGQNQEDITIDSNQEPGQSNEQTQEQPWKAILDHESQLATQATATVIQQDRELFHRDIPPVNICCLLMGESFCVFKNPLRKKTRITGWLLWKNIKS
ncbi:hypothetical protein LIER_27354 [Lithospermum erythrorhizon]|uniref:Retroviral polymerase SH3-like domain-containing protein n=1 Tax=Lithospermum erythrorhizon TaxID=34254 RepID=A0AAV3RF14_LITER